MGHCNSLSCGGTVCWFHIRFLSVGSFGWTLTIQVGPASRIDLTRVVEPMSSLTGYIEEPYGALMLDEFEEYEELIDALTTYIESGQSAGVAVHSRALAYWEIGDPGKALIDFDRAASLLPDSHMPFHLKGMLLHRPRSPGQRVGQRAGGLVVAPYSASSGGRTMPSGSTARRPAASTAWVRLVTCSLRRMAVTWALMVASDTPRS